MSGQTKVLKQDCKWRIRRRERCTCEACTVCTLKKNDFESKYPTVLQPIQDAILSAPGVTCVCSRTRTNGHLGEQGWRSGESNRFPPLWPGFKSWHRRHLWVEFVVCSLVCSESFFSGYSGFSSSPQKPTLPNSNLTRNRVDKESLCGCATSKIFTYLFFFFFAPPALDLTSLQRPVASIP